MEPPRFLILHKVRGEAEFDIAYKMMFGNEEGWLIPTIGHRAYPFMTLPLNDINGFDPSEAIEEAVKDPDWGIHRDHYSSNNVLKLTRKNLLNQEEK
jgi:hypothetical protein